MEPIIYLRMQDGAKIELKMKYKSSFFDRDEIAQVVYQDMPYKVEFFSDEVINNVLDIELLVNNEMIGRMDRCTSKTDNFMRFEFDGNMPIFHMTYGITEIAICVECANQAEKLYISSPLVVAVKNEYKDTMESVYEMLDDIYKKNHHLLYRSKFENTYTLPRLLRKSNDKFDNNITILKTILQVFNKNLPYYKVDAKYKTKVEYHVDYLEKLNTIGRKNISYMVTHPEEFKPSYGVTGVRINKMQMIPEKTLVSSCKYCYDTTENRIVVSFIHTLVIEIIKIRENLERLIKGSDSLNIEGVDEIKYNYILSSRIIQKYLSIAFRKYLDEYEVLYKQFLNIYAQYKDVLPSTISILRSVPKPTPIFLEIYHYRNVYEMINYWFGVGNVDIPERKILLQFSNADKIYEYYCLLNLYDILVSLGFEEEITKRCAYKYDSAFNNTKEENTYYFFKDNIEIVLYYQPVVYSNYSNTNNETSLFRTDGSFYTPDFIIKKKRNNSVSYAILDAKWRNRNTLTKKGVEGNLRDLVYKYIYSVVDRETLRGVDFFWLLQGKDDTGTRPAFYHRKGKISKMQGRDFRNYSGIVRLTPNSGVLELTYILKEYIFA